MNIFLPCPNNINQSVRSLDDRRLIKQILECKVLLYISETNQSGGYANHPVAKHYREQPNFLRYYGWVCCCEYFIRFNKMHEYTPIFKPVAVFDKVADYTPLYAEGRRTDPDSIRTTDPKTVGELFRNKLNQKWKTDSIPPKWTNRTEPKFYNA